MSRSKPSMARRRQETPVARMIVRAHDVAAVEGDFARRRIETGDRTRDQNFRAEPPRLLQRADGELVARAAVGKAEIVLDPPRRAGLAAGPLAFADARAQSARPPPGSRC